MIHARLRRQLSEHLDGTLGARARQRVERHLAGCEDCRLELADLRATVALLRSLPAVEEPEYLATRILARVEAGEASPSWLDRLWASGAAALHGTWTPAFAAVLVLFVVATFLRVQVDVTLPFDLAAKQAPSDGFAPAPFEPSPRFSDPLRLVRSSAPLETRRRFDPIVLMDASGVDRACGANPRVATCQAFREQLLRLALENPPEFVSEVHAFSPASQERVLSVVSREAVRSGHAEIIVSGLSAVRDPRAFPIVVRFQRTIASRD